MADDSTPFATAADLAARWRTLTTAETTRAASLLADASDIIRTQPGSRWKSCSAQTLTRITCAMVIRCMDSGTGMSGVTQSTQSVGPVSESMTWGSADGGGAGSLWLTRAEKQALGIGVQTAFTIPMGGVE